MLSVLIVYVFMLALIGEKQEEEEENDYGMIPLIAE